MSLTIWYWRPNVLILVLMEDALRALKVMILRYLEMKVLILVLMEDALREFWKHPKVLLKKVLILVLMEDALRDRIEWEYLYDKNGLNPCSNGRCSASSGDP